MTPCLRKHLSSEFGTLSTPLRVWGSKVRGDIYFIYNLYGTPTFCSDPDYNKIVSLATFIAKPEFHNIALTHAKLLGAGMLSGCGQLLPS